MWLLLLRLGLGLYLLCAIVLPAASREAKPKAPPGRDPGGIAVAVIGAGLDYRRPEIAARLARDGEGEPIAWDFADGDARPFAPAAAGDTALAAVVLDEGQAARLVVARTGPRRQQDIAAALRFAAATPARVALILADPGEPILWTDLEAAARQLPTLLLVVPARHVGAPGLAAAPAGSESGLLVVAAEGSEANADVASPMTARPRGSVEAALAAGARPEDVAAARVASLAARLVAVEPGLSGAALAARVRALAGRQGSGAPVIPNIGRLQWLE